MTDTLAPNQEAPAILVIFGITGDLAKRKVLPAIYNLLHDNLLPEHTQIVGTSRHEVNIDELLGSFSQVEGNENHYDPAVVQQLKDRLQMVELNPVEEDDYHHLRQRLDEIEAAQGTCLNRLFYLSIPPQVYGSVIRKLGSHGLTSGCQHGTGASRLLVEKPFGYNVESAHALITETAEAFTEDQIFRIDHYLAKETAQNILTFRRHNPLFASVWNRSNIRAVEVIAAEKIGIEGRANFYDSVGALRDLIQSHLLQLLTLTAMELPVDASSNEQLHAAKRNFLENVQPVAPDQVRARAVRGQYQGYRDEIDNQDSTTETFVSLELFNDLPEWQGVPLRLTTGKALDAKQTVINVYFGTAESDINQLTFRLQPDEGIDIELLVKTPGFEDAMQPARMDFSYSTTFSTAEPDAYERVLVDAIRGDHALFATSEEVMASWRILQPVLDEWQKHSDDLVLYDKGSTVSHLLNR